MTAIWHRKHAKPLHRLSISQTRVGATCQLLWKPIFQLTVYVIQRMIDWSDPSSPDPTTLQHYRLILGVKWIFGL